MQKNFLEEHYPQILELYYDYVNRDEYANHPITQAAEPISRVLNKIIEQLSQGNKIEASDTLTEYAIIYEQDGFILGFSIAMNLMRESGVERQ